MKIQLKLFDTVKYSASSFFILVGILNIIDTAVENPNYIFRDLILMIILGLPMIFNNRLVNLAFGIVAGIISIIALFAYGFSETPSQSGDSFLFYFTGIIIYLTSLSASMGLIYTGTHSTIKNSFELI